MPDLLRRYGITSDDDAFLRYSHMNTESWTCATNAFAQAVSAASSSPVYQYLFARSPVYNFGAFHGEKAAVFSIFLVCLSRACLGKSSFSSESFENEAPCILRGRDSVRVLKARRAVQHELQLR